MEVKPSIVITKTRRTEAAHKDFNFTSEDILPGELKKFRAQAWDTYSHLPFPTTTDEAWRRTDLQRMPFDSFRLPKDGEHKNLPSIPKKLLKPLVSDLHGGQAVMFPGGSRVKLDSEIENKGVIFCDINSTAKKHASITKRVIGQIVRPEDGKFAALASALSRTGILLYIPKGVVLEKPLHSILWSVGAGLAHISHFIIWLEEGASATYVHETASTEDRIPSLNISNLEIRVGEGTSLKVVELQSLGHQVWNFTHTRARVERNGTLDWIFGAVGSKLSKAFMEMDLSGEGASGRMSGFYFVDELQHLDLDTQQNHFAPHTSSDLLYKGALEGNSRVVWQGMIYVDPRAQRTDGYQANRNLVLSKGARADSIPGLEILADDVRCTHGATIGKLEDEPIFYLRSRGLPTVDAERLMVEGFFEPIMQRIPYDGVRERFRQVIHQKLKTV